MLDLKLEYRINSLDDTRDLAEKLAKTVMDLPSQALVMYLKGDLGAGKTTFCRYLIQALGHDGNVKSPTYTLVEPYELKDVKVFHFDLYRLADPEELEYMGVRDYFGDQCVCLIEWAQKGEDFLPQADLALNLELESGEQSRKVSIESQSRVGDLVVKTMQNVE